MIYMIGRGAATALIAVLLCANAALALPFQRGQRDFTLVTGYGENHRIPSVMKDRIRFDQVSLRWGRFASPMTQKAYEISLGNQVKGQENQMISAVVSHRHYIAVGKNTALGYDLAFGALRFQRALTGLATRLNFTEQVGVVLQHNVGDNSMLTLQYRFCHISNGDIRKPNVGINASVLSVGLTWFM